MKNQLVIMSALVFGLLGGAGCTHHMPLDEAVEYTSINGQITVNVFNNTMATAGIAVQIISPSGAIQTGYSGTSTTAGQIQGQVIFKEPYTGMYKVSLVPSSGVTPLISCATLSTAQPYASVNLQMQSTYLDISSADGKPFSYDETQTFHTINLTAQSTSLTNTVMVYYQSSQTTLPPGWQVIMNSANLSTGQSSQLIVQTAPYTLYGNVTISVEAVCASRPLSVTPIILTRAWWPQLSRTYQITGHSGSWDLLNLIAEFDCVSCSALSEDNANLGISFNGYSPGWGPVDLTMTPGVPQTPYSDTGVYGCATTNRAEGEATYTLIIGDNVLTVGPESYDCDQALNTPLVTSW